GLLRLGTLMKYMPQPVITGFTAGIAVSIFSSQVKDLLGLKMGAVPGDFFARCSAYFEHATDFNGAAIAVAAGSLALIVALRRWRPAWPGFLLAVIAGTMAAIFLALPADTIGSRFGGIPAALPQ